MDNETEALCRSCLSKSVEVHTGEIVTVNQDQYELPELTDLLARKGLKILHQNIRGLLTHKQNLCHILGDFKGIHILSLSETHLAADEEAEAQIIGYDFLGKPRISGQGGGVGIYISQSVPFQRRLDLEDDNIECIWIEILFPKSKGFLIGVIYRPPDSSKHLPETFNETFESMLSKVISEDKECILTGDINCNYLERSDHKELKAIFSSFNLKQLISSPTRITKESKTLIDVICCNETQNISLVKVIPAGLSDHELIGCSRKMHNVKLQSKTITCHNYSNYSPNLLCDDLKTANFEDVFRATSANHAWLYLKQILVFYFNKHAPLTTKRVKGKLSPWLTTEEKIHMNIRDNLLRKARRSNQEIDWSSYKNQHNLVTGLVKKCKNRFHKDLLKENAKSPSKFWATIKKLYPTKKTAPSAGSAFEINGSKTTDNGTTANTLCSYFSNVANSLKSKSFPLRVFTWMKPTENILAPLCSEKFSLKEAMMYLIMKATGLNRLSAERAARRFLAPNFPDHDVWLHNPAYK
eukprot:gene2144-2438_t